MHTELLFQGDYHMDQLKYICIIRNLWKIKHISLIVKRIGNLLCQSQLENMESTPWKTNRQNVTNFQVKKMLLIKPVD